jgi:hypothetical protein
MPPSGVNERTRRAKPRRAAPGERPRDPGKERPRSLARHKGNSGGPILDQAGHVTGIVNAKLDALAVQKRTGDLPQNISFGIKAEVAQLFLEAQNVAHQTGAEKRKLENTEVAAIGRAITVLVACRKGG